ncbi:putative C-_U-editing enzyme APOBEC-4 [Ascaphus truei]|uniref:putative C->U-editing enzyme APOBEC-4 n=1 Tax=Ascaphus truei TaxID=8439 RepID=UPI003F596547
MENIFHEFSGYHGTVVRPYYWLYTNQDCLKCPYHIRTGEEARLTYGEFYQAFGFPYGPTMPENKQIVFYELKTVSGATTQKGQVTNCVSSNFHAESMLFEKQGYLDSLMNQHDNIGYITLYSSYTPCNEHAQCCISKIYDFLIRYPQTRLDIYFSQLYHVEEDFPLAVWNCEALKSLAGLWPRVTVNPLSNGIWQTVLYHFVKGFPETALYQPVLPARASADRYNAYRIQVITGIKPYFVDVPAMSKPPETERRQEFRTCDMNCSSIQKPFKNPIHQYAPFLGSHVPLVGVSAPGFPMQPALTSKPKNIVRHLNMPGELNEEMNISALLANARKINQVVITEQVVREKDKEQNGDANKKKVQGKEQNGDANKKKVQGKEQNGDANKKKVQGKEQNGDANKKKIQKS